MTGVSREAPIQFADPLQGFMPVSPIAVTREKMATTRPAESGRHELDRLLLSRLEVSWEHYQEAAEAYRSLLKERNNGTAPDPDVALAFARRVESHALIEYTQVLRVFTDLVVYGKTPAGPGPAGSEDV